MKNSFKKKFSLLLVSFIVYGCSTTNSVVTPSKSTQENFTAMYIQYAEPINNTMNMMKNMMMVGSSDYAFVSMIIMHHQGIINFAKVEQKNGKDPEMKKLADDTIINYENDIKLLNSWIDKYKSSTANDTTNKIDSNDTFYKNMMGSVNSTMMSMQNIELGVKNQCNMMGANMGNNSMVGNNQDNNFCMMGLSMNKAFSTGNPDYTFASILLLHNQNKIEMAKAIILSGKDPEVKSFAQSMIDKQEKENKQLQDWINKSKVG